MVKDRIIYILVLLLLPLLLPAKTVSIADYGALAGNLNVQSTKAIQNAVDACHEAGGGTVIVPPGDYLVTTVKLKDHVTLHLEGGSRLCASRSEADYRGLEFAMGAADMSSALAVIVADNATDIAITGSGIIDCRAERERFRRKPQTVLLDSITGREIANAIKYGVDYQSKFRKVPPCPGAICLLGCSNVRLRDFSVVESSGWGVHIQWCDNVTVDGLRISSSGDDGVNSDGLDIDGSQRVTISNCIIDTGDDALCLKTTRGDGQPHLCRAITITNCVLRSSSAALKIGTETHYDFRDIAISNCVIDGANRGLNMIVRDGARVDGVTISNVVINTCRKATFWWGNGDPLWFVVYRRGDRMSGGSISNVMISNVVAHGQSGVRMEAIDGDINRVVMRDFHLFMEPEEAVDKRARNGFMFDGVDDLRLYDCEVVWDSVSPEPAWESAFRFINVNRLKVCDIIAPQAPGSKYPSVRLTHTSVVTSVHPMIK